MRRYTAQADLSPATSSSTLGVFLVLDSRADILGSSPTWEGALIVASRVTGQNVPQIRFQSNEAKGF